ncbi:MAG: FAD-dependent oxidoreductase [Candidatus Lokiarchaeota archaeon]|nr:FAD-dependent oxidoreductase [Candidatus Lokiarchaeota archaeon]
MTIPKDVEYLFKPIKIGNVEITNRIMMAPMGTRLARDGKVSDKMLDYYAERAIGGVGLLIVEMAIPDFPRGCTIGGLMLGADNDKFLPGLKRLADTIKREGPVAMIELSHGGRYCHSKYTNLQPIAPSVITSKQALLSEMPRELTTEEVEDLIETFGDSARRCAQAGFQGVELMGTTGYLINQFASPLTNQRTDRFGGKTPAGRATFIVEIIKNIRKKLGNNYPILYKISCEEYVPGGTTIEDALIIAKRAEQAGASLIHAWLGWHKSPKPILPMSVPRGAFVHLAEAMKNAVNIPIITGGRINDPRLANQIIKEGRADMVHMGRAFFADPYFPKKALKGEFDDIRMCIGCCRCFDQVPKLKQITCSVNAEVGKEGYKLGKAEKSKKVLIIGGGPAGMEAARVASLRGHEVILWEKNRMLGGNLILATIAPYKEEIKCLINYLTYQMKKLGVKVELGKVATVEAVLNANADEVIAAIGGLPIVPDIPGVDSKIVESSIDVLNGIVDTGDKVVIVGGGMIGCETAEYLASKGKDVTIIETFPKIARDIGASMRWSIVMRLKKWGINLLTSSNVLKIIDKGILVENEGKTQIIKADTIVIAMGIKSNDELINSLKDKIPYLHILGDCKTPARILEAIHEGYWINQNF